MPDSPGVPTRRGAVVLANARAHKCASTDRRYALMQTPALLRMPQERTTGATRRVVRSFKLRNSTSSARSLPPTLSVANSRYSLSLSLSHLRSSIISFLLRLHLPSRLVQQRFLFLPAHILHSDLVFFPFALGLAVYFSPAKRLCSTRLFSSYRRSLVYSPPSAVFCSRHRSPLILTDVFWSTSKHQPHVNFIVTVRVPNQRELTCNYRLATTLFLH